MSKIRPHVGFRATVRCLLVATLFCASGLTQAQWSTQELAELSLEQLREIVVSTVSRVDERLAGVAASVYVITAEDIRRSGVSTLPEALRLAPTLDVARADANQYAISARGFNNTLANKMLVLIDGRTVYTPLFSGVFWESQDVMLEDVERIEVITGPSTALWGTNAVNGLVHVITRSAGATQGLTLAAEAGTDQRGAAARIGVPLGRDARGRAYVKTYNRDPTRRADGTSVMDQADGTQVGMRIDWAQPGRELTLQGDAYTGTIDQGALWRTFSGAYLQARFGARLESGADLVLQGFVERNRREHAQTFGETLDTLDLVAEYAWRPHPAHRVLLGAGYRRSQDDVRTFDVLGFVPQDRTLSWARLFAQDRIELTPSLAATLALSVEHNPFTGTEALPSARLAWSAGNRGLAWVALSRSARAPSRIDRDLVQPAQPPYVVAGGPDFVSERAQVAEVGWRAQPTQALSYSLTLFHQRYEGLRSQAPTPQGVQFQNGIEGRVQGIEAWARWRAAAHWRLDAGFVQQQTRFDVRPGYADLGGVQALGNDPRRWASLASSLDITPRLAWELRVRHVAERPAPLVPAYTAVDTRLAWEVSPGAELALVVNGLFDPHHAEWGVPVNRVEVERTARLQFRWRL